jgi:hypothetical protein
MGPEDRHIYNSIILISDAKDDNSNSISQNVAYCNKLSQLLTSVPKVVSDIVDHVEGVGLTNKNSFVWELIKTTLSFDKPQWFLYCKIIVIADDNEEGYTISEDPITLKEFGLLIARRLPIRDLLKEVLEYDQIDKNHPEWQLLEKNAKTAASYEEVYMLWDT